MSAPAAEPTFTGPVRLTSSGIGFRVNGPDPRASARVRWESDTSVSTSFVTVVAAWPSSAEPAYADCIAQLRAQPFSSEERTGIPFRSGLGLCLENGESSDNTIVFLRLPKSAAQPS